MSEKSEKILGRILMRRKKTTKIEERKQELIDGKDKIDKKVHAET